jgi:hypothetical protein
VGRRRRTFQLKRQLRIDNRSLAPAPRQRSSANRPDDAEAARLSPSQLLLVPGRGLDEEAIEVHVASCAAGIDRTRRCALGSGLTLPAEPARTSERQAWTGEAALEVGTLLRRPTYADGCFRPTAEVRRDTKQTLNVQPERAGVARSRMGYAESRGDTGTADFLRGLATNASTRLNYSAVQRPRPRQAELPTTCTIP